MMLGRTFRYLLVAAALIAATRPADAAEDVRAFEDALKRTPEDVDLRLQYALFLSRNGDLDAAKKHAEAVLKKTPEYLDAHLLLGRILGWQRDFKPALDHVNFVLARDEHYPDALQLKLDLYRWMQDNRTLEIMLKERVENGEADADTYFRLAEAEQAELKYRSAYRNATKTLQLDPQHRGARNLTGQTRRVMLQFVEEFEYYDFVGEDAADDKKGGGFTAAATAFPSARFSASMTESVHYRFRTVNHRIAVRGEYKPRPFIALALMGAVGSPAHVIPKGTVFAAARGEFVKIMDASLSAAFDVLAWPDEEPAFLMRPAVNLGFLLRQKLRLGAAYTLGLLTYCENAPTPTHSGAVNAYWTEETVTVGVDFGYAQEKDPVSVGITPPKTCAEIADLQAWRGESFRTSLIHVLHGGINLTLKLGPKANLLAGYRFERKETEPYHTIIPTHISHLGLSVWF